jgi:hypothetical protein
LQAHACDLLNWQMRITISSLFAQYVGRPRTAP